MMVGADDPAAAFRDPGRRHARARTVLVRNAPPDSASGAEYHRSERPKRARPECGRRRQLAETVNKTETDAQIFVDVCPTVRRVIIVERALTPASPDAGCTRRDMGGIFLIKQISTVVIDFGGTGPSLLLRQGKVSLAPPRSWDGGRTGLMLFGGGGLTSMANVESIACGSTTDCSGDGWDFGYTAGVEYWFLPYVAAEGSYVRAADAKVSGSGNGFRFSNVFEAHVATVAGKVGVPAGRMRFYGHVGANYSRVLFDTNQTVDPRTTTVGGVTETVPGGTVTNHVETRGWGYFFGGGAEVWFSGSFAVFGRRADRDRGRHRRRRGSPTADDVGVVGRASESVRLPIAAESRR